MRAAMQRGEAWAWRRPASGGRVRSASGGRRRRGSWSWRWFSVIALGLALAPVVWAIDRLLDPRQTPIRAVQVDGRFQHLHVQEVLDAVARYAASGFLQVDLLAVQRAAESVPWVRQVSVQRRWPGTLRMRIDEQVAAAQWDDDELINVDGARFRVAPETIPEGLPRVHGDGQNAAQLWRAYGGFAAALAQQDLVLRELQRDARGSWRLILRGGVIVRLGARDYEAQLQRLLRAWPHTLAQNLGRVESIDLRYSNGFAVRWRSGGGATSG